MIQKIQLQIQKLSLGKSYILIQDFQEVILFHVTHVITLALGGADGVPAAIGHGWTANPHHLNSPTVYNSVFLKHSFGMEEVLI